MSEASWARSVQSDRVTVRSYVDVGDRAWVNDGLRPFSQINLLHLPARTQDSTSIKAWSKYAASEIDIGDFALHRAATLPQPKKQQQKQVRTEPIHQAGSEPIHRFRYDIHPHVYDLRSKQPIASTNFPKRIPPKALPDESTGVTRAIRNTVRKNHESRKNIFPQVRLRDGTIMPAAYPPRSTDVETAPSRSAYSVAIKTVPLYIIRPKVGECYVPDILRPVALTAPRRVPHPKKANESKKRTQPKVPVYVSRRTSTLPPLEEGPEEESSPEEDEKPKSQTTESKHSSIADWTIPEPEPEPEPVEETPSKKPHVKGDTKRLGKKARKAAKASQPVPTQVEDASAENTPAEDPFTNVVSDAKDNLDPLPQDTSNTANDPDADPFTDPVQEEPAVESKEPDPFEAVEGQNTTAEDPNPFEVNDAHPTDPPAAEAGDDDSGLVRTIAQTRQSTEHPTNPNYFMSGALPANPATTSAPFDGQMPGGYNPLIYQGTPWPHQSNHYYPHGMHPGNIYTGPPPGVSAPESFAQAPYSGESAAPRTGGGGDQALKRSEVKARATPAYVYLPRNPYNVRGGKVHRAKKKNVSTDEHLNEVWGGIPVSVATWRWPETWTEGSDTDN